MRNMNLPTSPVALTPEWLTNVLRLSSALVHATVLSFEMEPMPSANSQLLRLTLHYDRSESAPRTLIAKFPAANPATRAIWTQMGFYEQEVIFYQHIAKVSPLRTPYCYYAAIDIPSGDSLLLLEDLAPSRSIEGSCTVEDIALAICEIAKLHAHWWDIPQLLTMTGLRTLDSTYYQEFQAEFFKDSFTPFITKVEKLLPPELVSVTDHLIKHLPSLAYLSQAPQTIIHYDFHVGNMIFAGRNGEVPFAVVDWEFCRKGRGSHDVARLLGLNMAVEERLTEQPALLKLYYDALVDAGVRDYSFAQCYTDYRISALDCFARSIFAVTQMTISPARLKKVLQCGALVVDLEAVELL